MRLPILLICSALCTGSLLRGQGSPVVVPPPVPKPEAADQSAISAVPFGPSIKFKRVREFTETTPSPFSPPDQRSAQARRTQPEKGPNPSKVMAALEEAGVNGWIPAGEKRPGVVLIGSESYRVGQEIMRTGDEGRMRPLVDGHKVILSGVSKQRMALTISTSDGTAPINLPVNFGEQTP